MRRVDRSSVPVPASLTLTGGVGARERSRAEAHYATLKVGEQRQKLDQGKNEKGVVAAGQKDVAKPFNFKAYKGDDVKEALERLFHGKCAYCESPYGAVMHVQVEHYRPKQRVFEDDKHPGYWWLASEWTNLLPSCAHCNGNGYHQVHLLPDEVPYVQSIRGEAYLLGKLDYFPIGSERAGKACDSLEDEKPRIIDPTRIDPVNHLEWVFSDDLSLVAAKWVDGVVDLLGYTTYRLLGLNRQKLVEQRTEWMLRIELDLQEVREDLEMAMQTADANTRETLLARATKTLDRILLFSGAEKPYSMMAKALIDSRMEELERLISSCQLIVNTGDVIA